ncbi:hypothetical protein CL631_00315 [bacterium]|jgi:prepilin-type N-terminal cleavage/methylation domain-containing protein|nr:hypothetical protein [bacterium]MDP6659463.1 type II secretion system protein [Candidatus Paceibacterota bacterium]|tara:strand:- start:6505 stop:7080 length:576 start_codon:yes stop_codon:yes gene_type:complete
MIYKKDKRGFTLVEMLISTALFAVVMLVSVGSLLSLVDANRRAQSLKSVINNLNFALENMSRNIRVGRTYHCHNSVNPPGNLDEPKDCQNGGILFAFEAHDGDTGTASDQIIYRIKDNKMEKSANGGSTFTGITAEEVNITDMQFYVDGTASNDEEQPLVVITISGTAGVTAAQQTSFDIQTTVSQRLLDI